MVSVETRGWMRKSMMQLVILLLCQKIKVCYILLEILKYTKKLKSVTYKTKFQCVYHVEWDWGSHGALEKYVQETGSWKEDRVQYLQKN